MSLSHPSVVDVSSRGAYEITFASGVDASSLYARLLLPDGFSYSGESRIDLSGRQLQCEPFLEGQLLMWDLSGPLRSCRNVIINEWEANPPGSDTGMEWIEIFNPTAGAVDMGGWRLVDSHYKKTVFIPANTIIGPGRYKTINWTNGSLINSHFTSISLQDPLGLEVDCTLAAKDGKNNDLCWARYSNGRDLDSDSDWKFQKATPGSSNGGGPCDIYSGEILRIQFNLTAGCSAPEHIQLSAEMQTSSEKISSSPLQMNIGRANLSLSVMPDRFDIAKGDEITWTIIVENDGNGTAHDVLLDAALSDGLLSTETNSPIKNWSYSSLSPGSREEISLKARAVSTKSSYSCDFSLKWGPDPCQVIGQVSPISPRTAIAKEPDQPRALAIGEDASFTIFADLPRGARDLWINDTISRGLIYNPDSLSSQCRAIQLELAEDNADGSLKICWFFGDVGAAEQIEIGYSCMLDNAESNQNETILPGTSATMNWNESGEVETDFDEGGPIRVIEPNLSLEIRTLRAFAAPNDRVTYLLNISHPPNSEAPAFDLDLQALLPPELVYEPGSAEVLVGPEASFDSQDLKWHIDTLDMGWTGSQEMQIRFDAICQALPGDILVSRAILKWTSLPGESPDERTGIGGIDDYLREAQCHKNIMNLTIQKTADPDPAPVGEILIYSLTYENQGNDDACNVNITDEIDPGVSFISSDPAPSWNNTRTFSWTVHHLMPDEIQTIVLKVIVNETLPDASLLKNCFFIRSDELDNRQPTCIYTSVLNATRLAVNKTALQKAVRRGEEVDYIIRVCNRGGQPATNITVRDVFDTSVEFLSASPEMAEDGAWHLSYLAPGQCLEIRLKVRVPRTDVIYHSSQSISGRGFVRSFRDYSTSRPSAPLINRVYVTSDQMQLSASAYVEILAEAGTEISLREHGSGDYEEEETLEFLTANKSIRLERSITAEHHPANLSLPGSCTKNVSSLWSADVRAKNGVTNTSLRESYRYSALLEDETLFDLDENQSTMKTNSSFEGVAHMGMLKLPHYVKGRSRGAYSEEDYAGAFRLSECIRDFGQGWRMERSASGLGFMSRDGRDTLQRSYESGSGEYRADERMDSISGLLEKELDARHRCMSLNVTGRTSLNISQGWSEGMISRTNRSLISEEYFGASRLNMTAISPSPSERQSEASFSGIARLRTAYKEDTASDEGLEMDAEEILIGDYELTRKIILAGTAMYDGPHISLRKDGRRFKDVGSYIITICNNGNSALGPIFLQDLFPDGAGFINATLRPNEIENNSTSWTLLHLAIGDTLSIGINLDLDKCEGDIINRAVVVGNFSGGQVAARNISLLDKNFLGCCPAQGLPGLGAYGEFDGCGCSSDAMNQTDFLDPMELMMQWDSEDDEDGSCPLSCPALEGAGSPPKS
ncbi:MAG: lamin tail domain-containing protein [Methanothrix sp.]